MLKTRLLVQRILSNFRKTDFVFPVYCSIGTNHTIGGINWKDKIGFSKITDKPLELELSCKNKIFYANCLNIELPKWAFDFDILLFQNK